MIKKLEKVARKLTEDLADNGKIIEGGWLGYKSMVLPPSAGEIQSKETRMAFYAGAAHLYASILCVLEPGNEPSARDLDRMQLIHIELENFNQEMALQSPTKGQA